MGDEKGRQDRPEAQRAIRGRARWRFGKVLVAGAAVVAVAAAVTAVVPFGRVPGAAAAGEECPASSSGTGGGAGSSGGNECPDLTNEFLGPQRPFPRDVFRTDTRPPEEIFRDGFTARGTNYDLPAHVRGTLQDSGWISTAGTIPAAEQFMASAGLAALADVSQRGFCARGGEFFLPIPGLGNIIAGFCQGQEIRAVSFMYTIDPTVARNAVYVPDQLGPTTDANLRRFFQQDEWAYVHRIPPEAIVGVRIYRFTARRLGTSFDPQSMTQAFDRFVPNPAYINRDPGAQRYQPNRDAAARFLATTALNFLFWVSNPRRTLGPGEGGAPAGSIGEVTVLAKSEAPEILEGLAQCRKEFPESVSVKAKELQKVVEDAAIQKWYCLSKAAPAPSGALGEVRVLAKTEAPDLAEALTSCRTSFPATKNAQAKSLGAFVEDAALQDWYCLDTV